MDEREIFIELVGGVFDIGPPGPLLSDKQMAWCPCHSSLFSQGGTLAWDLVVSCEL